MSKTRRRRACGTGAKTNLDTETKWQRPGPRTPFPFNKFADKIQATLNSTVYFVALCPLPHTDTDTHQVYDYENDLAQATTLRFLKMRKKRYQQSPDT